MRIVCPACEAEYDVPDTVAGGGRKVRCARCQTVWFATDAAATAAASPAEAAPDAPATFAAMAEAAAEAEAAAGPDAPAGELPPLVAEPPLGGPPGRAGRRRARGMDALAADPASEDAGGRRGIRAAAPWIVAWVLSLAVLGGLVWAGGHWRAEVVRLWPASQRLYAVLGQPEVGNPPVTTAH